MSSDASVPQRLHSERPLQTVYPGDPLVNMTNLFVTPPRSGTVWTTTPDDSSCLSSPTITIPHINEYASVDLVSDDELPEHLQNPLPDAYDTMMSQRLRRIHKRLTRLVRDLDILEYHQRRHETRRLRQSTQNILF